MALAAEPIRPTEAVALFNGKDFTGLTDLAQGHQARGSPQGLSRQGRHDAHLRRGFGYVATDKEYRDYQLVVEYKWGKRTDGGKFVRNSGVLLHGVGPDGGAGGVWMSCIECQLAQGCVGDLIVIRGKDDKVRSDSRAADRDVELGPDKRPRWKKGGEDRVFTNRQLWWSLHDPDFKELLDTRGKDDVESPLGQWTKVECICAGKQITRHRQRHHGQRVRMSVSRRRQDPPPGRKGSSCSSPSSSCSRWASDAVTCVRCSDSTCCS